MRIFGYEFRKSPASSASAQGPKESLEAAAHRDAAQPLVVEVEESPESGDLDSETKAAILSLGGNMGFRALCRRQAVQAALLKKYLEQQRHKSLEDVAWLQAGIFWAKWYEKEVDSMTRMESAKTPPRDAKPFEQAQFDRIKAAMEIVGGSRAS